MPNCDVFAKIGVVCSTFFQEIDLKNIKFDKHY